MLVSGLPGFQSPRGRGSSTQYSAAAMLDASKGTKGTRTGSPEPLCMTPRALVYQAAEGRLLFRDGMVTPSALRLNSCLQQCDQITKYSVKFSIARSDALVL